MKTRILTMLAILAVVIPALLLGGIFTKLLVTIIIAVGTYELTRLSDHNLSMPFVILLILCELAGIYLLPDSLLLGYIGTIFLILLALPVFNKELTPKDSFVCMSCISFFILMGHAFMEIFSVSVLFVWLIIIATYVTDSFAYLGGRALGKHKLIPRVSPNKTIEGSVCGYIVSCLVTMAFGYFVIDAQYQIVVILAAIFLPVFGQIGDLAFSAIKRCYGIKDFGNIFPGHGGMLDRVDSLLFNIMIFYFLFQIGALL